MICCRAGREQFSRFKDLYLKAGPDSGPGLLKQLEFPRERLVSNVSLSASSPRGCRSPPSESPPSATRSLSPCLSLHPYIPPARAPSLSRAHSPPPCPPSTRGISTKSLRIPLLNLLKLRFNFLLAQIVERPARGDRSLERLHERDELRFRVWGLGFRV
jgi:hypothetical protein